MILTAGTKLGSYEVAGELGAGGMGIVYRARDTRLARDVAIKMLPGEFVSDPDRLARFQREAKVLASLNHPNIGAIYGLEDFNGAPVLILELVEGETLAERLTRGAIPAEEALRIAIHTADALEAAHDRGVIHRDLKPGNIKITPDGKVKVLDFGLAKAVAGDEPAAILSNSPTLSHAATMQGVILGTAAYMPPEQAKGRTVTRGADIWAFGCVLFEMLAGRPAFEGEDVSEILASVIKGTTNLNLLPADLHPAVRRVTKRCLEKDLAKRFRDIGDVRYELAEVLADATSAAVQPAAEARGSERMSKRAWIVAIVVGIVAAVSAWSLKPSPRLGPGRVYHFEYQLPEGREFEVAGRNILALSSDGSRFLYKAIGGLYWRSMDSAETTLIPGTGGTDLFISTAVFSPDGEWIALWTGPDRQIKKVPKSGGAAVLLCSSTQPFGIDWSTDNNILYGQSDGVWRVSANGGKPERIIDAEQGEQVDSPQLLPGTEWVLFTSTRSTGPNRWDQGEIVAASLKSKHRKTLWRGGSDGRYVPTGHLVYALGNDMYAVPFDLKKLETIGGQVPIIQGVRRSGNPAGNTSTANYAFSNSGSLIYIPGSADRERTLVLVERAGTVQRLGMPAKVYLNPRLSPDEKKIAVETEESNGHAIWVYDLAGTSDIRQLTLKGNNERPIWMPDSRHVTFASDQDGPMSIYTQPIDGSPPERLTTAEKGTEHWPESWSPDGSTLSFALVQGTDSAIWTVSPATRTPKLFADETGVQRGSTFSPDGKWIAYHSAEGGTNNIYVQAYPAGPKKRVTQDRRSFAVWPTHGNELFYSVPGGGLFARTVSFKDGLTFGPEQAVPLPNAEFINNMGNGYRLYDVSPDGKRFLVMLPANETTSRSQINIVLNWFEELKQKVH